MVTFLNSNELFNSRPCIVTVVLFTNLIISKKNTWGCVDWYMTTYCAVALSFSMTTIVCTFVTFGAVCRDSNIYKFKLTHSFGSILWFIKFWHDSFFPHKTSNTISRDHEVPLIPLLEEVEWKWKKMRIYYYCLFRSACACIHFSFSIFSKYIEVFCGNAQNIPPDATNIIIFFDYFL